MKPIIISAGMAAVALLAGCQKTPPASNQAAAANQTATSNTMSAADYEAKIAALPEPSRNGVFLRALQDAGYNCQKVVSSEQRAPMKGHPAWTVRCQRGIPFVAVIDDGGYIQAVPAAAMDQPQG
ncbi:MAG: hypothetical protein ACTHMG_15585 [Sphingomonas sp.]